MSENNSSGRSGGIGFIGLLTIVFIVLKLTNVIQWSWFWVLSPMIFSIGLGIIFLVGWYGWLAAIVIRDKKRMQKKGRINE